jgi:mannose/cellobiose epimerase-like protein (N-acyl-D-glucosamine 2-epimerase family)
MQPMKMKTERLFAWVDHVLVPLWMNPKARARNGLFVEELDSAGTPLQPRLFRTIVCARQAYFFLRRSRAAGDAMSAMGLELVELLSTLFVDRRHGGFVKTLDGDGSALDERKDLYTYAFVIFAFAQAYRHTRAARYAQAAAEVLEQVRDRFWNRAVGAYNAVLSADLAQALEPPAQNPHMHLFEALDALCGATGTWDQAIGLVDLGAVVLKTFWSAESEAIMELPLDQPENWIEPGHQFEWFALAAGAGHPDVRSMMMDSVDAALRRSVQDGLRPGSVVPLKLTAQWQPLDGSARIWTQLEFIRAAAVALRGRENDAMMQSVLDSALDALHAIFLKPHAWIELVGEDGSWVRRTMPASTPYHFVGCLEALRP